MLFVFVACFCWGFCSFHVARNTSPQSVNFPVKVLLCLVGLDALISGAFLPWQNHSEKQN